MEKYGIFINHRHDHCHLAGRVFDFFEAKGFKPFLDIYSIKQTDFKQELFSQIVQIPYFLCILTKGALDNMNPDNPDDIYYKELNTVFEYNENNNNRIKILVIADIDFHFSDVQKSSDERINELIKKLQNLQYYTISMRNFYDEMEKICKNDINTENFTDIINWREKILMNSNILFEDRTVLQTDFATLQYRFGHDFIECIKNKQEFTGQHMIKHINMACYAANIIFASKRNLVDQQEYDYGMMFNIFTQLLKDNRFSMTLITNAPGSFPATDAIQSNKLGNDAFSSHPEAVFLSSYANISELLKTEPYKTAKTQNRFRYLVSKTSLPFSYFQIIYKDDWKEFNHIKIDLYTEGLSSSTKRNSFLVFEHDNPENYHFLEHHFSHLKNREERLSSSLIKKNHQKWVDDWSKIVEELNLGDTNDNY